ncbi:hypothetical protein GVX76_06995 [[Haemophilus] felis]|nr:hypothetical protein [[Haemophilus] felis]
MSNQDPKKWYARTHDFAPYTRADGVAVSEEFDAIQQSFEVIPQMRNDGKGFAVSPVIPEPTQDNHPATYGQLKNGTNSVVQMKASVEETARQVAQHNQTVSTNTRTATQKASEASRSATTATQQAQLARQQANTATQKATEATNQANIATEKATIATRQAESATNSASSASQFETLARKWAINPEDNAVQSGEFSAYHHAQKAKYHADRANSIAGGRRDWSDIDNIPSASTRRAGIIQLSNDITEDETKAATPKAVKTVKDLLERRTANLNFIPNGKKSSATNSNSEDNVATSRAVKTAYDLANSKQSPATTLAGYGITDFQVKSATGNLNDYRTAGIYSINSIHNSYNRPAEGVRQSQGFTGNLQVITGGAGNESWCHQIFRRHYSGETYERWQTASNNNSWSEWKRTDNQDGLPIGSVVAFPKEINNPQGFLRCDGTTFAQSTYPDLYRVLGNKNRLPNLTRSDVGQLAYFPTDTIPDGWIAFDTVRTAVTERAYPELYRHLVAKYGNISQVPQAEDRFIRNAGNGLRVGEKQEDEIKAHNHVSPYSRSERQVTDYSRTNDRPTRRLNSINNQGDATGRGLTSNTGGSETRPKSIVFKLCIKAKNSFDDVQFWIKAFGEVTNAGTLDAGRLAQNLQDKADRAHTHTVSQITDFAQGVAGQFSYQKTGNFTIRKFPDGTMLQTYVYEVNDINDWVEKNFTWAVAFSERPLIIGNITSSVNNNTDQGINILSKSTATAVYYRLYEHWGGDQGLCRVQFFAVGRWF